MKGSSATPVELAIEFSEALNRGALNAAIECMARGAVLITPDATAITGPAAIRAVLAQMVERSVEVFVEERTLQQGGQVALVSERWTIRSPGPGTSFHEQRTFPLFAARQIAGEWKLVHLAPWRGRA